MFYFYNTCLISLSISSLCSGGIITFSTFLEFTLGRDVGFTILSAILFLINSNVASAALWTAVLVAVFKDLLTLIWEGFLGVYFDHFEVGEIKWITQQTSNLVRKYTHMCSCRKYTFSYQGPLNFADVSIFCKKSAFLAKIVPLLKAIVRELC